ncbi:hypothetical protein ACFE04_017167 [Oxalis oulophora]
MKELFETADGLLCRKCGGEPKFVVPRYKIEFWVVDPSGFEGGNEIVPYGYEPIPKQIELLINKSFVFGIKQNDFNISTKIHSYIITTYKRKNKSPESDSRDMSSTRISDAHSSKHSKVEED